MSFTPFDGVLLDDSRDPIPGAVAIVLHRRVERTLAARDRRPPLAAQALRDRAAACQALLAQGLLPRQLRALEKHGLILGQEKDPRSLASLVRHLEHYLEAAGTQGYLEPSEALWRAAADHVAGRRGFWIERHPEDGPLEAGLKDLTPPRLRSLCAMPELGLVRFRIATRRGAGAARLFEDREPHLVRQMLPALENLAVERGLDHLELETPEGWGGNPWGPALDGLFDGPLVLDDPSRKRLQRALLPTDAAVWRGAVEQIRAWRNEGIAPEDISLVHPDPAAIGPVLAPLLAADGIPLKGFPGRSLKDSASWGSLWTVLAGLRDLDPSTLAAGLMTAARTPLGRSLRVFASLLAGVDQTGEGAIQSAFEALPEKDGAWLQERWAFLLSLRIKSQTPSLWAADLQTLNFRLELVPDIESFHSVLGLLGETWSGDTTLYSFTEFLEDLEGALETMRAPDVVLCAEGVNLVATSSLLSGWTGSEATLLMDLGEGIWPSAPTALPELDWARQIALNRALRAQTAAGEGEPDFPPHLQTFLLPQAEEGEILPRAFHREAYGFNRALALTRRALVALSADRDGDGQRRAQGPFWQALDGVGAWIPEPGRAVSTLRWRWTAAEPDAITRERQAAVKVPVPGQALDRMAPACDRMPGIWTRGTVMSEPMAPTMLESLARCPFRVFAGTRLKLDTWNSGEAHVLNLGTLAHRLMEALLAGLEGEPHWPSAFLERYGLAAVSTSGILTILRETWREKSSSWLTELGPTRREERARLHLSMEDLMPAMAEGLAEDVGQQAPYKEELEFLEMDGDGDWQRELVGLERRLEPRSLGLPGGSSLWVHGTLDRIERWVAGSRRFLRIVDYKTSRAAFLKAYREDDGAVSSHLQLPLYQLLMETEHQEPVTALLVSLREPGKPVSMMLKGEARSRMLDNIGLFLDRAVQGHFPSIPGEHCLTCALSALCGRPVDIESPEGEDE